VDTDVLSCRAEDEPVLGRIQQNFKINEQIINSYKEFVK
jgi:hypothetical protein